MQPRVIKTDNLAPLSTSRGLLHETLCQHAESEFKRIGEMAPLWLFAIGSRVAWVETPWETQDDKIRSQIVMWDLIRKFDAHAYAFASEVWAAKTEGLSRAEAKAMMKKANRDGIASLPPHQRDDLLIVISYDRESEFATHYLVTNSRHGLNFLGPRVDRPDLQSSAGRLVNVLRPEQRVDDFLDDEP